MSVTPNFQVSEFDQPAGHGLPVEHYPAAWVQERLLPLCRVLEIIREALGKPIHIGSGYRSPAYNKAIGGAPKSQHMLGKASDITVNGVDPKIVHDTILDLYRKGAIKIGGLGYYPGRFVHVDIREGRKLARWTGSRQNNG